MADNNLALRAAAELELRRRRAASQAAQNNDAPMTRAATSRYVDNFRNLGQAIYNVPGYVWDKATEPAVRLGERAAALTTGNFNEFTPPVSFTAAHDKRDAPLPTTNQILAGGQMAGEALGALATGDFSQFTPFDEATQQQALESDRLAEEYPGKTMAGNVVGDVASMLTARSPVANARGRTQMANNLLSKRGFKGSARLPATTQAWLKNVVGGSKNTKTLMNAAGRAGEAGMEGYILGMMHGDADPAEQAAFMAGNQAAGSVILTTLGGGNLTKGGVRLAVGAAGLAAILQALPGIGAENWEADLQTSFEKVALAATAGILAGASGQGRITSGAKSWAPVLDQITAALRTTTASSINEIANDPVAVTVLNTVQSAPGYFGESAERVLANAMEREDVSFSEAVAHLMENDREFRKKLSELEK